MSDDSDIEQSSSDMNVASWLSHATLDLSVSFLSFTITLVIAHPDSHPGSEEVSSLVDQAE